MNRLMVSSCLLAATLAFGTGLSGLLAPPAAYSQPAAAIDEVNIIVPIARHPIWRQQPISGHGEEDSRLAHEHHEHDGGKPENGTKLDEVREPRQRRNVLEREGDRVRHVERRVVRDTREHERHQNVENRANRERQKNANGHVLLRIFRLLRSGRDGVEADVREEDDAGGAHDARPSEVAEATAKVIRPGGAFLVYQFSARVAPRGR